MSAKFLIALTAACIAFAPGAMSQTGPGTSGTPDASRTTTVKSSKSNTSDRMGGGGGAKGGGGASIGQTGGQTDRMGGGGGKSKDPAKAINLNSSRSN
jgi:hypothetical protein